MVSDADRSCRRGEPLIATILHRGCFMLGWLFRRRTWAALSRFKTIKKNNLYLTINNIKIIDT